MLYAILCYNSEAAIGAWSKEYHDETMARLHVVNDKLARQGRLGPVARLLPTTAATTLRKSRGENLVIDSAPLRKRWVLKARIPVVRIMPRKSGAKIRPRRTLRRQKGR